jgi:hypothetical protein
MAKQRPTHPESPADPDSPAAPESPGAAENPAAPVDPHAEYTRRRTARSARAERARRVEDRISNARLLTFVAGAIAGWLLWGVHPVLVLLPVLAFALLVAAHERAHRARSRAERATAFYDRGLARLEHRFSGIGHAGDRFLETDHPYSAHLDLFGEGSLYELLCGSQTSAGRETLASWLLDAPSPDLLSERHVAVDELRDRLDLREELAMFDPEVVVALESRELVAWSEAPPILTAPRLRFAALALAAAAVLAAIVWSWLGGIPMLVVVLLELAVAGSVARRVREVLGRVQSPARDLRRIRAILGRLETERFATPRLVALHDALDAGGSLASRELDRLLARMDRLDWRGNLMFAPIAPLLLWTTNFAFAIERWRLRCGGLVAGWISAVGELEAFLDLASYAYEHPSDPFPELSEDTPLFDARGLGHPLLPEDARVLNDVHLDERRRLLIVTGSNMSGKSTLLRSVGVNLVLARIGAPVCATSLRLSPLSLAASIRTVDSLQEGASRFYAEVQALQRAVEVAGREAPALFLLDELLHGTNSHDRRIGADGILRALLKRGAIGIATTHDLALAEIADALAPQAANAHFEFRLAGQELEFDYRLRPGVVQTGNALELMRAVGLEV